ncbi:MAG: hypothetical protein HFJ43_01725 [Clostridia bacterium]|nr:hypothetical protein [Clostridia bacterium]
MSIQSNLFLNLINSYINKQDFDKCNNLLKKEIVYIYTKKIRKYNKKYSYSTTVELLDELKSHLSFEECIPYIKFFNILNEDCMKYEKTNKLLQVYNEILLQDNYSALEVNENK